jgi:hypothetical protein
MRKQVFLLLTVLFIHHTALADLSSPVFFMEAGYQSVRSLAMGSTQTSIGIFDDNLYGNPARIASNPFSRLTLLELTPIELNSNTLSFLQNARSQTSSSNSQNYYESFIGKPVHARIALVIPALYITPSDIRDWALSVALTTQTTATALFGLNYALSAQAMANATAHATFAYRFGRQNPIKVGITSRTSLLGTLDADETLGDFVQTGQILNPKPMGAGYLLGFDLGGTARLINHYLFQVDIAASLQNIFNTTPTLLNLNGATILQGQPRNYSFGIAAFLPSFFWLESLQLAAEWNHYEATLNTNLIRIFHLGFEATFFVFKLRAGLNKGYLTAGLGLNLRNFTLDVVTTAEELGTNLGQLEDRRFALSLGVHI